MYRQLRTNLPREVMAFLDFPFSPHFLGGYSVDPRRFCSHEEVSSGGSKGGPKGAKGACAEGRDRGDGGGGGGGAGRGCMPPMTM